MKCPKCGHKIPTKMLAAEIGRKGGSVSSDAKKAAAKRREKSKRMKRAGALGRDGNTASIQ